MSDDGFFFTLYLVAGLVIVGALGSVFWGSIATWFRGPRQGFVTALNEAAMLLGGRVGIAGEPGASRYVVDLGDGRRVEARLASNDEGDRWIELQVPVAAPPDLHIRPATSGDEIAQWRGRRDIQLGMPELDALLQIEAEDEAAVVARFGPLTRRSARTAIVELGARVGDGRVTWTTRGHPDGHELSRVCSALLGLAEALGKPPGADLDHPLLHYAVGPRAAEHSPLGFRRRCLEILLEQRPGTDAARRAEEAALADPELAPVAAEILRAIPGRAGRLALAPESPEAGRLAVAADPAPGALSVPEGGDPQGGSGSRGR